MTARLEPARPLGGTGVTVPLIGYGTAPLGKDHVSVDHAVRCLHHAIDLGVTYIDTSPDYGSEPKVGEVMKHRRDEVFLATKVNNRRRESVHREIDASLRALQTDRLDLVQVHAVSAWADLEQALAPGGAVDALVEARDAGKIRFLGITGHSRPELLGHALEQFPFDVVLAALGMADRLVTSPETFLLPRAREKNVGVVAMKVLGHGQFANVDLALRYSLGLDGVSLAIVGMDVPVQVDQIVDIASRATPLTDAEFDQLLDEVRPLVEQDAQAATEGPSPLFWLHDTAVMGWRQDDEPVSVTY